MMARTKQTVSITAGSCNLVAANRHSCLYFCSGNERCDFNNLFNAQFGKQVATVQFNRAHAETQPVGDLFVDKALHNSEHF